MQYRASSNAFPERGGGRWGALLKRGVALVVLFHLVAILALAASPRWHLAAHDDADEAHHTCAVTLISGGGLDVAPLVAVLPAKGWVALDGGFFPAALGLESAHLARSVLEHGPPRQRGVL